MTMEGPYRAASPQRMISSGHGPRRYEAAFTRLQRIAERHLQRGTPGELTLPSTVPVDVCDDLTISDEHYRKVSIACRMHACRLLMVLIIECFCFGASIYGLEYCRNVSILIMSLTILAIICALLEWGMQWVWRDSSPMLIRPRLFKSYTQQVGVDLEHEVYMIDPPGSDSAGRYMIHDLETTSPNPIPPHPYENGGGFRGGHSWVPPMFDFHRIIGAVCLTFIYLVGCVALIGGLVWVQFEAGYMKEREAKNQTCSENCEDCPMKFMTYAIVYLSVHLAVTLLRFLSFLTCEGTIMRMCINYKLSEPKRDNVPIVVHPMIELPSQKNLFGHHITSTLNLTSPTNATVALRY